MYIILTIRIDVISALCRRSRPVIECDRVHVHAVELQPSEAVIGFLASQVVAHFECACSCDTCFSHRTRNYSGYLHRPVARVQMQLYSSGPPSNAIRVPERGREGIRRWRCLALCTFVRGSIYGRL